MVFLGLGIESPIKGRGDGQPIYHLPYIRRVYGPETPKFVLRSISTAPCEYPYKKFESLTVNCVKTGLEIEHLAGLTPAIFVASLQNNFKLCLIKRFESYLNQAFISCVRQQIV